MSVLNKNDKYIIYKGHKLSKKQVFNNLKKLLELAESDDYSYWYKDAFKYASGISKDLPFTLCENISKSCGIIAALSPQKSWELNQECAESFIETGNAKNTRILAEKAIRIFNSDGSDDEILKILNGPKITSFYSNIRHPESSQAVTIDRHALSCCFMKWVTDDFYRGMTKNQYDWFELAFQGAAKKLDIQPSKLQSITWLVWRRVKNQYKRIDKKGKRIDKKYTTHHTNLPYVEPLKDCPF